MSVAKAVCCSGFVLETSQKYKADADYYIYGSSCSEGCCRTRPHEIGGIDFVITFSDRQSNMRRQPELEHPQGMIATGAYKQWVAISIKV